MNFAKQEVSLEGLARSRGIQSLAYRQYADLKGRAMMLENLEKRLAEMADYVPITNGISNIPNEEELFTYIITLLGKIELLERGVYDNKIGCE